MTLQLQTEADARNFRNWLEARLERFRQSNHFAGAGAYALAGPAIGAAAARRP